MKKTIRLKRDSLFLATILASLLLSISAVAYTNPSTGVGHNATEVGPGTFSSGDYAFPGDLNIISNLFMSTNSKGIFWATSSQDVTKPHIDYSSTTGLWISAGTTGTDIFIEGGNLVVNKGITLGGVTRNTWPKSLDVPAGFCIFSDTETSCPSGWIRRTTFDGRTIRGSTNPGFIGGSNEHKHIFRLPKNLDTDGSHARSAWGNTDYETKDASSWPPYRTVIICCTGATIELPSEESPAELISGECPVGYYMSGINDDGTIMCRIIESKECPIGSYMAGINSDGTIICRTIESGQCGSDAYVSGINADGTIICKNDVSSSDEGWSWW